MVSKAVKLYELKKEIIEELESILPRSSLLKARRDPHSRRKPRPCGITIHPGHGCPLKCLYCYIYDMSFPDRVTSYPLNPLEIVYALAINPYVVPTKTLAAIGSVTEPFLPEVKDRTISYIKEISKWLQLPVQVSTKMVITHELARKLSFVHPQLSVLISITSLKMHKVLEPLAPSPELRIYGGKEAAESGLRVDLFLRPIIPGLTENEVHDLLKLVKINKFKGVVAGSLRVTKRILEKLGGVGVSIEELIERAGRVPIKGKKQVSIRSDDIKLLIKTIARREGLEYLQSACAANILAHKMSCGLCKFGPCGNVLKSPSEKDILDFFEYVGIKVNVNVVGRVTKVTMRKNTVRERNIDWLKKFLEDVYKLPFVIKLI